MLKINFILEALFSKMESLIIKWHLYLVVSSEMGRMGLVHYHKSEDMFANRWEI